MLFYLTNVFLDVVWGTAFWVVRKTGSGIYYLMWGDGTKQQINEKEYEAIVLNKDNIKSDEHLRDLLKKTSQQEIQIRELNENIKELTKLVKEKND